MSENASVSSYSATIIPTERGAQMQYTNPGAGCMVIGLGIAVAGSLLCFYIAVDSSFFRAVTGFVLGIVGLLFFGTVYWNLIAALLRGRVLLEFDGKHLTGRKNKQVTVSEITEMTVGRHFRNLYTTEDLVVKTRDGKVHVFHLYSLLSVDAVQHFAVTYLTPICGVEPKKSDVL